VGKKVPLKRDARVSFHVKYRPPPIIKDLFAEANNRGKIRVQFPAARQIQTTSLIGCFLFTKATPLTKYIKYAIIKNQSMDKVLVGLQGKRPQFQQQRLLQ